ncbi:MAG TPA: hypothetical protein VEK57_01135 [Thermoanaerobaculia bacterium]|nr:hypothetical protein [Thermoanaerobaculia bacterium]
MTAEIARRILVILFLVLGCIPATAQEAATSTASSAEKAAVAEPAAAASGSMNDSHMVRVELHDVLQRLPPEVGRVLKLDPALWNNESYIANYPELAAFVRTHPEVTRTPAFFLQGISSPDFAPEPPGLRLWRETMEGIGIFAILLTFVGLGAWLIKTFVQQRRWSRVSKIQAEVHNKLLDRFASNQELLAYIQTSAGKRFLESAPLPVDESPSTIHAPINRILWSVQAGLVIGATGLGLRFVSMSMEKDVAGPMAGLGSIAIAIGLGLVVSAAAAFLISRRLGLWQPPAQVEGTTAD